MTTSKTHSQPKTANVTTKPEATPKNPPSAEPSKKTIPGWVWIVIAVVVIFVALPTVAMIVGGILIKQKMEQSGVSMSDVSSFVQDVQKETKGSNDEEKMAQGFLNAIENKVNKEAGGKAKVDLGTLSGGAKVPDDFPKDIPLYEGGSITLASSESNGDSLIMMTVMGERANTTTIGDFYVNGLKKYGWVIKDEANAQKMQVITATKDTRELNIVYMVQDTKEGKGASINLVLKKK